MKGIGMLAGAKAVAAAAAAEAGRGNEPGNITVLADRYESRRLNSPNDLVYRSDGALYLTDPPFGLPKVFEDPAKELPFSASTCCATASSGCSLPS